ncbi:DSD1 family PLP-dependent enzyme [Sphingomonas alpina]|uniref:DSD1 family PLP-dependent enzyme n=1 Tax=Sphingomonas alpina TaxID=653931 RepID=A0A7H0LPM6_9SPHN|nr:DSD1 family PLP-dependent enzyme [Sphingomonas alpina]QNQ11629.1 DSD1 family PLP-dependent enzyme [Sphingomonas alpina]
MTDLHLHDGLIDQQGSRAALNTPVLVIDRDALDRNIARMADFASAKGVKLRPHAKTHKSLDIARLQLAAGAVGICCAKLGEAEALTESGEIGNVLITSPVVSAPAIARLKTLHDRIADLMVVVDHPDNVRALAAVFSADRPLGVLIDIDPGIRRTGVGSLEAALALAKDIAAQPSLKFNGLQCYCGVHQHIASYADRRTAIEERTAYLSSIIDALAAAGAPSAIVSGGGTGTHRIDGNLGAFTELQVGSYVFMDRQYAECDLGGDGGQLYETALVVDARVVSANAPGMVTIDAGYKAFATDGGSPVVLAGAPEGATYRFMGDEHGAIFPVGEGCRLADVVSLQVPHCDPTVNLYDAYHVVRGDTLIDIWPVTARGRSR